MSIKNIIYLFRCIIEIKYLITAIIKFLPNLINIKFFFNFMDCQKFYFSSLSMSYLCGRQEILSNSFFVLSLRFLHLGFVENSKLHVTLSLHILRYHYDWITLLSRFSINRYFLLVGIYQIYPTFSYKKYFFSQKY